MVAVAREREARQRRLVPGAALPARRLEVVDEEWLRRRAGAEWRTSGEQRGGEQRARGRAGGQRARALPYRPSAAVIRRRRLVAAVSMAVLSVGLVFGATFVFGARGSPAPAARAPTGGRVTERVWIVRPGDTVWSLVEASGVRGDIRPVVDRIEASLHNRPLRVGQRVVVPVAR